MISARRTFMMILGFERGGFFIWSRRLEQGLFATPPAAGHEALALSSTELMALIDGIDGTVRR